jgi:NAD(P)-dependent dehydrogenase (short-subunit alcohol dehydrogenase family)
MVEAGAGVIVNAGSTSGEIVNRPQWQPAYNASKAGGAPSDEVARRRVGALRRAAVPEEIAPAVFFLASPASAFTTGPSS